MGSSLLNRRERIIVSTIEVINEVGFQKLSTKLIAECEGVSEGTLFRHFKNKADIMLAVLEHFSQYDEDIIQASINRKLDPVETIRYFINTYAEYYENYPAITAIAQSYDSLLCDCELAPTVEGIVNRRAYFMLEATQNAQNMGMIDNQIDCENLVHIIFGGFKEICLKWRMNGFNFPLRDKVMAMLNMVLNAIVLV
jgi:AcrR family transcriptional regulator